MVIAVFLLNFLIGFGRYLSVVCFFSRCCLFCYWSQKLYLFVVLMDLSLFILSALFLHLMSCIFASKTCFFLRIWFVDIEFTKAKLNRLILKFKISVISSNSLCNGAYRNRIFLFYWVFWIANWGYNCESRTSTPTYELELVLFLKDCLMFNICSEDKPWITNTLKYQIHFRMFIFCSCDFCKVILFCDLVFKASLHVV